MLESSDESKAHISLGKISCNDINLRKCFKARKQKPWNSSCSSEEIHQTPGLTKKRCACANKHEVVNSGKRTRDRTANKSIDSFVKSASPHLAGIPINSNKVPVFLCQ